MAPAKLVDVEGFHLLEARDLVEIKIVGHHKTVAVLGQLHQLGVDLRNVLVVDAHIDDLNIRSPQLVQHVEPAAAAHTLEGIAAVGNVAQLIEDKVRDDERTVQKSSLADLHNASVDDHTRVKHLWMHAGLKGQGFHLRVALVALVLLGLAPAALRRTLERAEEAVDGLAPSVADRDPEITEQHAQDHRHIIADDRQLLDRARQKRPRSKARR